MHKQVKQEDVLRCHKDNPYINNITHTEKYQSISKDNMSKCGTYIHDYGRVRN